MDITADQFKDQSVKVIVTENSTWHKKFKGTVKHKADFNIYDEYTRGIFLSSYEIIKKHL